MDNQNVTEKVNNWAKNSIGLKIITVTILVILLMIPSSRIIRLIDERSDRRNEAVAEVESKWGQSQTVCGPVITIPFYSKTFDEKGKAVTMLYYAHFLPEELNITCNIDPEKLHRSIYDVILYKANLKINGTFQFPDFNDFTQKTEIIDWQHCFISFGISDLRFQNKLKIRINGNDLFFNPGMKSTDVFTSGVSSNLLLDTQIKDNKISFETEIILNGSESLHFIPVGKETTVIMNGKWSNPSFDGHFLPVQRKISDTSFYAKWKYFDLNRNYPQKWVGNAYDVNNSSFGVNLLQPVDEYQKTTRSAKYNLMFIILTFLVIFLVELIKSHKIHPVQYLMLGFAVSIFYLLLLSLSEQIAFNLAYLIAGVAVIGLVGFYSYFVFKSKQLASLMIFIMILLYSFFFTLLQMQDLSLLIGSIGLFIILAFVMYLSRNIDWYSIKKQR